MARSIVLASGGIESNTLIAKLVSEGQFVVGLFFDLGLAANDHNFYCASQMLNGERGRLETIDVRGLKRTFLQFMSPSSAAGEADKICPDVEFLPIYVSIAAYYGESSSISQAYVGFTAEQMSGDRQAFLENIGKTFSSYDKDLSTVNFLTPFAKLTKGEVIEVGSKLGVDFTKTWSCLRGGDEHCGTCEGCKNRKLAFTKSRVPDPTKYQV